MVPHEPVQYSDGPSKLAGPLVPQVLPELPNAPIPTIEIGDEITTATSALRCLGVAAFQHDCPDNERGDRIERGDTDPYPWRELCRVEVDGDQDL